MQALFFVKRTERFLSPKVTVQVVRPHNEYYTTAPICII
jgi:hypothetical protein